MGKLIAVEGLDGSGKTTQTGLLYDAIVQSGRSIRSIKFPDYASESSSLVKMYLRGELGSAESVNAYAASSFYAVDRYANYQTAWKQDYQLGKIILTDRYVTSNLIYQAPKLPKSQWESFTAWLEDFEYIKLELPRPDMVIYLDMPVETSQKLMSMRYEGDEGKKDIHENNMEFLKKSRECALFMAQRFGWRVIDCLKADGEIKDMATMHSEIFECAKELL